MKRERMGDTERGNEEVREEGREEGKHGVTQRGKTKAVET